MNKISCLFLMVLSASAASAFANTSGSELDQSPSNAPATLIVREDAQGNLEAFKSADETMVFDDTTAEAAIAAVVNPAHQIGQVPVLDELDQTTSNESWFRWYNPSVAWNWGGCYASYNFGWNFGYNLCNIAYTYVAYYGHRWGGFIYHFFHRH